MPVHEHGLSMGYALGIDGGNTKTIALVARLDGTIVGTGRGGCTDIYNAGSEGAMTTLEETVTAALNEAGIEREALEAASFSMAGADWPEDYDFLREAATRRGFGKTIVVYNDAIGALRAGSPDGTGVVVACGTGTATGARAADGRFWHTSFWQEPQGGGELGDKTLGVVYRAELGLEAPTTLTARVLEFFQQPTVEDVLHLFWSRHQQRPSHTAVSKLSRVLLDEASQGDAVASRIVKDHGYALGDYALLAARRVGLETTPFYLVLAGGVLRHPSRVLSDAIIERVRTTSPELRPILSRFEPAVGSLFLALEAAGVCIDEALIEQRLVPSLPSADLFAT